MNKLPDRELFRVHEVAAYFAVDESTIRRWIVHGHLTSEKIVGIVRISRDSIVKCRFYKKYIEETDA